MNRQKSEARKWEEGKMSLSRLTGDRNLWGNAARKKFLGAEKLL